MGVLNPFIESVVSAFGANIGIENMDAAFKKFSVRTIAAGVLADGRFVFPAPIKRKPTMVTIAQIVKQEGAHETPTNPIFIDWILVGGQVSVDFVGLDADSKYDVTLYVM